MKSKHAVKNRSIRGSIATVQDFRPHSEVFQKTPPDPKPPFQRAQRDLQIAHASNVEHTGTL